MRDWDSVRARAPVAAAASRRAARPGSSASSPRSSKISTAMRSRAALGDAEADAYAARADRRLAAHGRRTSGSQIARNARPRLERSPHRCRRHRRHDGREGGLRMIADLLRDMRYAVRQLCEDAGVHRCRDPDAGARHRREHARSSASSTACCCARCRTRSRTASSASTRSCRSTAVSRSRRQRSSTGGSRSTVFERIAAYNVGSATLAQSGKPERVTNASVSWDLFELLGVDAGARPHVRAGRGRGR